MKTMTREESKKAKRLYVDPQLHEQLRLIAEEKGVSLVACSHEALSKFIKSKTALS